MNVSYDINGANEAFTDQFFIGVWEEGSVALRTLTPFGIGDYLRASLYNGITVEEAERLAHFMREFAYHNS